MSRRFRRPRSRAVLRSIPITEGDVAIDTALQEPQLGTGHAMQQAAPLLPDDGTVVAPVVVPVVPVVVVVGCHPLVTFGAHWAPNGVVFYAGNLFPARYRGGAFLAFHGSWNRAPGPQGGYNVVFVPFSGGNPAGPYEPFADGFAGTIEDNNPRNPDYRPVGLAVGPDGSLFIADSQKGRIWRVSHDRK